MGALCWGWVRVQPRERHSWQWGNVGHAASAQQEPAVNPHEPLPYSYGISMLTFTALSLMSQHATLFLGPKCHPEKEHPGVRAVIAPSESRTRQGVTLVGDVGRGCVPTSHGCILWALGLLGETFPPCASCKLPCGLQVVGLFWP